MKDDGGPIERRDAVLVRTSSIQDDIDLKSLSQALLVADLTSFSGAARSLGVKQSSVSRRVQALEDKLGISLFERQSNGVRTTISGLRFFERTRTALTEIQRAIKEAATAGRGAEGSIRIGVPPAPFAALFCDVLRTFRETHSGVVLDFIDRAPDRFVSGVTERRLDVAFVVSAVPAPGCDTLILWTSDICTILPSTHPLSGCEVIEWELLKDEHFVIGRDAVSAQLDDYVIERMAEIGARASLATHDISQDLLLRLVAQGFGISVGGCRMLESASPGVVFRPLAGDDRLSCSAVWLPGNDNPALRRFLSLARSTATEKSAPKA